MAKKKVCTQDPPLLQAAKRIVSDHDQHHRVWGEVPKTNRKRRKMRLILEAAGEGVSKRYKKLARAAEKQSPPAK
jgi:hypothetical protein